MAATQNETMLAWVRKVFSATRWRFACMSALVGARHQSLARLGDSGIERVLVVCYGNICRSAFVEAYFKRSPVPGVEVRSVGFHPVAGRTPPVRHIDLSRRHGIDLGSHRSRILSDSDLQWAQLIVLMDRHNWQALVKSGADPTRLVWLGVLDGGATEIPDPYPMDGARANAVVARLAACSAILARTLTAG